jgi:hypothetical protein
VHSESVEGIQRNLGDEQPSILLAVCGDTMPGRITRTRRTETVLVRSHMMLPEFPFLDIGWAEFPILVRLVDADKKAPALLVLREVKKEFHDAGPLPTLPSGMMLHANFGLDMRRPQTPICQSHPAQLLSRSH